jgi:hypothetical protein
MMKRIISIALITLGIVLTMGALSVLFWNSSQGSAFNVELPNQIAGVLLTESQEGEDAIAVITNLHGQKFPVDDGAVGIYGNRAITVWIADTATEPVPRQMTDAMQQKIAEGNSPFTPIEEIQAGNRTVYALKGMGQRHYYFQSQNLVIWLAVDPAIADEALQQILEVYS